MFLSQRKYALNILEQANMLNCKTSHILTDTSEKLHPIGPTVVGPSFDRSLVDALRYLTFIGPYIAYEVHQVCLFMHDPREPHFTAL